MYIMSFKTKTAKAKPLVMNDAYWSCAVRVRPIRGLKDTCTEGTKYILACAELRKTVNGKRNKGDSNRYRTSNRYVHTQPTLSTAYTHTESLTPLAYIFTLSVLPSPSFIHRITPGNLLFLKSLKLALV